MRFLLLLLVAIRAASAEDLSALFTTTIAPVLKRDCQGCHGSQQALSKLNLESRAAMLPGGQRGPAVAPGNANASLLYQAIAANGALAMPPGGAEKRLPPEVAAAFKRWIDGGAPWEPSTSAGGNWGKFKEEDLWAFRPLRKMFEHSSIDAFILARLSAKGVQPAAMPEVIDLSKESPKTLEMYGIGGADQDADAFGRRCLLARRLISSGVRFVQVIAMGWDSHDYIKKAHGARMRAVDKGMAALITDLKRTGLLDETLVVWSGEFGRSPDNGIRQSGAAWGRDHNATAMPVWLAGGGVPAGRIVGATDDVGLKSVEAVHPIKNFHVTLLHLLGLDDAKLRYLHAGREKQLSQTVGEVIRELIA